MLISVICPVYNTEKVLGKCIRSVLMQDFKNIELILVNDGSTDRSLKICQKYANKDQRILIIDKPNEGRILARKDGVLLAQGEYVFFIDSDDYIEKDAIDKLVNIARNYDLDMVVGNYDRVFDNWGLVTKKKELYEKTYIEKAYQLIKNEDLIELMLRLDLSMGMGVECLMTGRIYRRSCIKAALNIDENHLFPPTKDVTNEDVSFNLAITPFIQSCMIINDVLYHYRWGGDTARFFPYISKGGYIFDFKYKMCQKYSRLDLLPNVYCHYKKLLCIEVQRMIQFSIGTMEEIHAFVEVELSDRKIAQWAIKHVPTTIALETRNVIDNAVKSELVQKKHYRQKKLIKVYMWFVNNICSINI